MIKRLYFLCLGIALGHSVGCADKARICELGDESDRVADAGE